MSTTFTDTGLAEKILLKLWEQCENEESCDVILIARTKKVTIRIPAHRLVLSAASKYFDEKFASSMSKSEQIEVKMPEIDGDILQRLVEYCYTGCVVISEEIVVGLLQTAHMLHLVNVVTACGNVLTNHLHPSNCLGVAKLAQDHCCETLLEEARYYSLDKFLEVCKNSEFLSLSAEQLSHLLASDDLRVENEEDVFNSLMRWIEHDRKKRVKHIHELLKLVRMRLLEPSFLTANVKPICKANDCDQIYDEAIDWHSLPDSLKLSQSKLLRRRKSNQILMGITCYSDNKMYVHYYCPQRNEWVKWLKNFDYRGGFGVAIIENYLLIVGGEDTRRTALNTVIRINLTTMMLEKMTPMNEQRAGCRAAALNGILYVVGGHNGVKALNSVEKWNTATNKWNVAASMLTSRHDIGIAVLNEKLYVVGGYSNGNELNSAECYDPNRNEWQFIGPMRESRQAPGVIAANGMLYVVGGTKSKTVERYDPKTNQWTTMCSLRKNLYTSQCCTSLNDKVVVCYKDRIEEFDAATNEWKEIMAVKLRVDMFAIHSYSDKLLTSEFVKI